MPKTAAKRVRAGDRFTTGIEGRKLLFLKRLVPPTRHQPPHGRLHPARPGRIRFVLGRRANNRRELGRRNIVSGFGRGGIIMPKQIEVGVILGPRHAMSEEATTHGKLRAGVKYRNARDCGRAARSPRFRGLFGLVSGVFRVLIGLCSASDRVANGG